MRTTIVLARHGRTEWHQGNRYTGSTDLPIDEVKLDRNFIAPVTSDPRAAAVAQAVIDLTHDLGATVVAEGIEDVATADWLRDHGCDVGQGYLFGRPVEAGQIGVVAASDVRDVDDAAVISPP